MADTLYPRLSMMMHPSLPWVVLYDEAGLAVVNVDTGFARVFDLGEDNTEGYSGDRWALAVDWNPTNMELALIIGAGPPILHSNRLFVLDAATGELTHISVPPFWVRDVAWAPNGQHLLARVQFVSIDQLGGTPLLAWITELDKIVLVSPETGAVVPVKNGAMKLAQARTGLALDWSPDGRQVAVSSGSSVGLFDVTMERIERVDKAPVTDSP
jgi:WD40 repeat protein